MSITNINEATKYPSDKIKEALDIVAPIETKTVGIKKVNQWTTPGLLVSLKHSHKLYVKQKKTKNATHKAEYKAYKKLLEKLIRISKIKHYESTIGSAGADTKNYGPS